MPAKSTAKKPAEKAKATKSTTKPKATKKPAAKASTKPKAATKTAAKPSSKAAATTKAAKATKTAAKPKATAKAATTAKTAKATKTAAKTAAKAAKPAATATKPATKTTAKPKATKPAVKAASKAADGPDPAQAVRPLIKVRQAREFTSKKVTKAELEAITEVARWSGSSRNEQPCRFVTIRSRDLIRRVADLGLPQTRGLPTATAAVAIVVPEEPERELSRAFDDGRAAERMLIAAHMLGLGGGISRVRKDVRAGINEALGLPSNRSVRTILGFGHPTDDALQPKSRPGQARLPREEVVYNESWPDPPAKD